MSVPYRSPLRDEQKQLTRDRILDAVIATLATGVADLSVPAVARRARVSVPTVYRHFPNKKVMLGAVAAHVARRTGLPDLPWPRDPEALAESTRELFLRLDSLEPELRAAMASRLGAKARRQTMIGERRERVAEALARALRGRPAEERDRLVNVVLVLWSSAALQAFKDYLGLDAEQAAQHVGWAIRVLSRSAGAR